MPYRPNTMQWEDLAVAPESSCGRSQGDYDENLPWYRKSDIAHVQLNRRDWEAPWREISGARACQHPIEEARIAVKAIKRSEEESFKHNEVK
jgi:hypothetical protein